MSYLLDTNVLSEVRKRAPDPRVAAWFETAPSSELFISVLLIGEVRQGIGRLRTRDQPQAKVFERWLETLKRDFRDRIIPISANIAEAWGRLNTPTRLPVVDSLLAATALVHGLTLVTRDTTNVEPTGIPLLDPWTYN